MEIKRIIALLSALFMLAVTVSCGSSGGGSSGGGTCESGVGTWAVSETSDERDCGSGFVVSSYNIVVTQSGCNVTLTTPVGVFSGTMSGSTLTGTGSYPDDGGTTTATITGTISGNSISGTSDWTWVGGTTCSGTSTFTGSKL